MAVEFELLSRRPVYLRLDTLPFGLVYAFLLQWQLTLVEDTRTIKDSEGQD
jgi:hypothetical protein